MNIESPSNEIKEKKEKIRGSYRELGPYLTLGFQLAAAVVVFFLLGNWIDSRFGIDPLGKIIGTLIGMAGGFIKFFKSVASMIADEEQNRMSNKREN